MNDSQTAFATALAPEASSAILGSLWQSAEIKPLIELYAARPLFENTSEWIIRDNPYRRPVDPKLVQQLDFSGSLTRAEVLGTSALAAHRMLLNIYETDLIFLPATNFAAKRAEFSSYYSNDNKLLGELIRPALEAHVFSFLNDEINVTGKWTVEALKSYMQSILEQHEKSELDICKRIVASANPQRAGRALLIQVAGDFLSEASASTRNILGKYGEIQSQLFKIVIDDYGYGVHPAKHSTLFENTLATCGLMADVHAYWHFYLSSSLAINNYYHYVSRDHSKYFRAIGAVAIAEAMFSHTCREISMMLRTVFGKPVDTYYFDEHYHIDAHHGRMAFDNVVAPAIARHGNGIIPDIVRGMEELQLLTAINDEDLIAQIEFADSVDELKTRAQEVVTDGCDSANHVESRGHSLVTIVNDHDKLYLVESGSLDVIIGDDQTVRLDSGQSMIVPRQRLHGIAVVSEECRYRTFSL
ncbi:MAG TPA: iron-containing redox enzyme family protein [Pyrinomonadaceae bacterium]|jgi:mannose-6-phosphate isomerase-like protein (cupin superfamily)|nr:iron-containing redox enzyme family protein [Pyrinomonadaceae bacterium]